MLGFGCERVLEMPGCVIGDVKGDGLALVREAETGIEGDQVGHIVPTSGHGRPRLGVKEGAEPGGEDGKDKENDDGKELADCRPDPVKVRSWPAMFRSPLPPLLLPLFLLGSLEEGMPTAKGVKMAPKGTTTSPSAKATLAKEHSEYLFRVNFSLRKGESLSTSSATKAATRCWRRCLRPKSIILTTFGCIPKAAKGPADGLENVVSARCPILIRMELEGQLQRVRAMLGYKYDTFR